MAAEFDNDDENPIQYDEPYWTDFMPEIEQENPEGVNGQNSKLYTASC